MTTYTGAEMAARALRFGASPALARIMGAASLAEGCGDSDAPGDWSPSKQAYTSWGPYQMGDVHGLSVAQRCDLDFATTWMLGHEFARAYAEGLARGYGGELLARWTCMRAERPEGWRGPDHPGLDSPAADNYARHWHDLEEPPMPNLREAFLAEIRRHRGAPYVFGGKSPQSSFDCSGLLTWCARQVGLDLGDPNYTSADGLRGYCDPISMDAAQPGDLYLFHTTYGNGGIGYATHCGAALGDGRLMLDTHGEPWPGCGQTDISSVYWQRHLMGAWRPRGFAATEEEDPAVIAELRQQVAGAQNTIDYLEGDVADAFERAIATLEETPDLPEAARDAVTAGLRPALATLRRGGPPSEEG